MAQAYNTPYTPRTQKIIVLLGECKNKSPFKSWYLEEHSKNVCIAPTVTEYIASLVINNTELVKAVSNTGGSCHCPYNILGVDFVYGEWDDIKAAYNNCFIVGAYQTTEYNIRKLYTNRPNGIKNPEPERIGLLIRPENMSHEQAMKNWVEKHPEKALLHHTGLAAYTINTVDHNLLSQSPQIDGINSLAYWNLEAIKYGHFSRPDSKQEILEDCSHFRSVTYTLLAETYIMKNSDEV